MYLFCIPLLILLFHTPSPLISPRLYPVVILLVFKLLIYSPSFHIHLNLYTPPFGIPIMYHYMCHRGPLVKSHFILHALHSLLKILPVVFFISHYVSLVYPLGIIFPQIYWLWISLTWYWRHFSAIQFTQITPPCHRIIIGSLPHPLTITIHNLYIILLYYVQYSCLVPTLEFISHIPNSTSDAPPHPSPH